MGHMTQNNVFIAVHQIAETIGILQILRKVRRSPCHGELASLASSFDPPKNFHPGCFTGRAIPQYPVRAYPSDGSIIRRTRLAAVVGVGGCSISHGVFHQHKVSNHRHPGQIIDPCPKLPSVEHPVMDWRATHPPTC